MHEIRRTAGALALAALPAARATEASGGGAAASAAAGARTLAAPRTRPAPPWNDDLPADRATALLLLAGVGLLALRASRNRE